MMILRDNARCSSTSDNIGDFLALQNIANRNVAELENEYGKDLLIYPTSQEHSMKTYMLRGYGEDDQAKLQTYLFQIPQNVNNYRDFMLQIVESEHLLCKQM